MTGNERPTILILSFSPIAGDARVLKQIDLLSRDYAVTTCGIGPFQRAGVEHIEMPNLPARKLEGRLITLRQYRTAFWRIPAVRWSARALRDRRFDIILANDVEAVPVALRLRPRLGVHADLHEYTPRLHEQNAAWVRSIQPFWNWVCRRYVRKATSWSTVSAGLARQYQADFGFLPTVVTNATPFLSAEPTPVHRPMRLVHSGVCLRNRDLLTTIRGVQGSRSETTLDMFLTPNDPAYLAELRDAAAETPDRVRVNDPVAYEDLVTTLQDFDLGIFVLPPNSFSHEWALPNKLFDFVQARLGVIVGPSPEMAAYVRDYDLGVVTDGFDAASITRAVDALDDETTAAYKQSANRSALALSAGPQLEVWRSAIDALAHRGDAT